MFLKKEFRLVREINFVRITLNKKKDRNKVI